MSNTVNEEHAEAFKVHKAGPSSFSVEWITPVQGVPYNQEAPQSGAEMSRGGVPIYTDPLFETIKKVLSTNRLAVLRSIKVKQINDGTKLVFYQGNPSNHWGFIDIIEMQKTEDGEIPLYNVRIFNSYLRNILKEDSDLSEFFKDIL